MTLLTGVLAVIFGLGFAFDTFGVDRGVWNMGGALVVGVAFLASLFSAAMRSQPEITAGGPRH